MLVLMDPKGKVTISSGYLPRKRVDLPQRFTEAPLQRIEPTFKVGPLLGVVKDSKFQPILPVPHVHGYEVRWVET